MSQLMQYRTTSDWQDDWVVEVGNWLARGRELGYLDRVLAPVLPQRTASGSRDAGDRVHRNVTQRLAQAMVAHYFIGTGWGLGTYEPRVTDLRGDGSTADIDLQMCPVPSTLVDMQVKASGGLGAAEQDVDDQIIAGIRNAAQQLPDPPLGRAFIVISALRRWPLYGDTHVVERLLGSTTGYSAGRVLLHGDSRGELACWTHVSGIVILDHRRGLEESDYGCVALQNPWAHYQLDGAWFPHARVLTCVAGEFTWLRGAPSGTTFPTGTRLAPGAQL
jgi:hypothetical protein